MRQEVTFYLNGDKDHAIEFLPTRLINAGYTGRDQEGVQAHIREMKALGIAAPDKVPCFYLKNPALLEVGGEMSVIDRDCSGEAEFALLFQEGRWYIGCGADVFDKSVEAVGAAKAKHLYPNQISRDVWALDEIRGHLDKLVLRSWLGRGRETLYQEGELSKILRPEDLIDEMQKAGHPAPEDGFVLFSGTLACLVEGMPFTECFAIELYDPVLDRALNCTYETRMVR